MSEGTASILPLLLPLILLVPLIFVTRANSRRRREVETVQRNLAVGDKVITTSGMYGTVTAITNDTVDLEVGRGVRTTWARAAIGSKAPGTGRAPGSPSLEKE